MRPRASIITLAVVSVGVVVSLVALAVVLINRGGATRTVGESTPARRPAPSTTNTLNEPGKDIFLAHQPGTGPPLRLGATAAYDACTVLPVSAVRDIGIELDPYFMVMHDHLERDTPTDATAAMTDLKGFTNCTWTGVDKQFVTLKIYQPPYSDDRDRTGRLEFQQRQGAKEESVRGLKKYTVHGGNNDPKDWQVTLFADDYWAQLTMMTKHDTYRAGSPQDVVDTLIDGIAENLLRGPTAPSTFSYSGPYAGFPDPCTLYTREDFRATHGVDDTGRVTRGVTGGDQELRGDSGERARYIRISCDRRALGKGFSDPDAPALKVEFHVYPDAEQASLGDFGMCDPKSSGAKVFGPPLEIKTKIGDGRVCMPNIGRDNDPLVFRAGRTLVYLYNWLLAEAKDRNALAAKLTPAAQAIAARLPR